MAAGVLIASPVLAGQAPSAHASGSSRLVYVTALRSNQVAVIDPASDSVITTVPVGSFPEGVDVTPDNTHAYAVNDGSNTVSVIGTAANTVSATVPVGRLPGPIAISPDGSRAYVGRFVSPGVGGVDVIDTATNTVTATVQVANQPFGIAVTPDGSRAYVACFVGSAVSVIDTSTNAVIATISDPNARTPASVAITPDGTRAYVANFNSNNVSVIDTATNTITALIPVGSGPEGIAISPDGAHAYVANASSNTVSVIDTSTNTVTASIPVGSAPVAVAADQAGGTVYVADSGGNTVSVIDTSTNTVTATIGGVGNVPFGIAMAPPPVTVSSLSPSHGAEAGGATVTITGTHLAGASSVMFGSTPATNVKVINQFSITATVPAHTDGTVDVTVTTPAGTSPVSPADQYTYDEPAPAVTAVTPSQGTAGGGTIVTITGTDFLGATSVSFGTTPATSFTVDSDTQITATAPAGSGTVDVTVTTPAGTSPASTADRYTYFPPCPAGTSVHIRWHYSGAGSAGSWSATTAFGCPSQVSMGPQAMEGDLKLAPGAVLKAGYDFTIPGSNNTVNVTFTNPQVTFRNLSCVNGTTPTTSTITVPMPGQTYTSANGGTWYPSGDQSSSLVYQGTITIPDICQGGDVDLAAGGTFTATIQ